MTKLYIKTHNTTGLKYFGKTVKDDAHKYTGSGTHWLRHIKTHGYDVKTEIFGEYSDDDVDRLTKDAIQFSEDNQIVESKEWANLIVENGLDGVPMKISDTDLALDALNYTKKSEYRKQSPNNYQRAKERGLINEITSHMICCKHLWTKDDIKEDALKYTSRSEFFKHSASAYLAAERLGIFEEVCSHMVRPRKWTKEKVQAEALKYSGRRRFYEGCRAGYSGALRLGIMDEVCSHMPKDKRKLKKNERS